MSQRKADRSLRYTGPRWPECARAEDGTSASPVAAASLLAAPWLIAVLAADNAGRKERTQWPSAPGPGEHQSSPGRWLFQLPGRTHRVDIHRQHLPGRPVPRPIGVARGRVVGRRIVRRGEAVALTLGAERRPASPDAAD